MNNWNGFDFFIFIIFALNMFLGMSRGASKEIISFMCLSLALIFTIKFTVPLANFLNRSPLIDTVVNNRIVENFMVAANAGPLTVSLLQQINYSISMIICFTGAFSVCEAGLSYTGFSESYSFPYATLSRKVGGSLGVVRGYVISLLIIAVFNFHIFKSGTSAAIGESFMTNSFFVNLFKGAAAKLDGIISGQNPENYREIYKAKDLYKMEDITKQLQDQSVVPQQPNPPQQAVPPQQPLPAQQTTPLQTPY